MLLLLLVLPRPVQAQEVLPAPDLVVEASVAFAGNYLPGRWLPITVRLTNTGADRLVQVRASLPADADARAYVQVVDLPQGSQKQVVLYLPLGAVARLATVQVVPVVAGAPLQDQVLAEAFVDLRPRVEERLLGIISDQPVQLALPARQDIAAFPFVVLPLTVAELPDDPRGLDSLTLLLLHDAETSTLREAQRQALLGWVARGGHLLIGGGSENQRTLAGLPPALQPATLGGAQPLDTRLLRLIVGGADVPTFTGSRLAVQPPAQPFGAPDAPLLIQRSYSAGLITQLAFSPLQRSLQDWAAAPDFWNWLLRPARLYDGRYGVEADPDSLQNPPIVEAAASLPASNLPFSVPLFGVLLAYLLLVGPLLALLLARLDRQPLTWLLVPLLAGVMLLIGVGVALAFRADQRIVSQSSMIEATSSDTARIRTATLLLVPQLQQFIMQMPASTLLRPVDNGGQTAAEMYRPVPDDLLQQATLQPLRVARWETQGLLADQTATYPLPQARLILAGSGARVDVSNTTPHPLRGLQVSYANQHAQLATLLPGEQVSLPLSSETVLSPPLNSRDASLLRAARPPEAVPLLPPVPRLLAFVVQASVPISVPAQGAARQQTSLLSMPLPIEVATEQVVVPPAWFVPDFNMAVGVAPCQTSRGTGILPQTTPITVAMTLPDALAQLVPERMSISLDSERELPLGAINARLYAWQRAAFDAAALPLGTPAAPQAVPAPAQYVQHGRVLLVLDGDFSTVGCVRPVIVLQGATP